MSISGQKKLVSQLLSEDEGLRDIVEEFVQVLPTRLDEMKQAFEALDWSQLTTLAHRLKGASGSYGYPDLSAVAAEMESAFRDQKADDFAQWTQELSELIAAAAAGLQEG